MSACKNETSFGMTARAEAFTTPPTGQGYWSYTPPPPGAIPANPAPQGSIINGADFNPSSPDVPQSGGSYMVYYVDTSSGCSVYDSTTMVVSPVPVVKISYPDGSNLMTVCRNTNEYYVYTQIDKMDGQGLQY